MQVFLPFRNLFECAESLDKVRRNKQIVELTQIIKAIKGETKAWSNHPVVKMYKNSLPFLENYKEILCLYSDGRYASALNLSEYSTTPEFITSEFCDHHKSRLYTKSPDKYMKFNGYGLSYDNWYIVDGVLLKYKDGKKIGSSRD